ncbi:MAG: primase [Thermoanaerobacterium sp.]|nr:primase [Thermoanaerobacterium sp.]
MNIQSAKEFIKENLLIEDVISEYIHLEKSGKNYKALCPFHTEDTPSFFVFPNTQTFKCFGCGAQGDVITFVEKYENISFVDAIKKLSKKANITLEEESEELHKRVLNILNSKYYETLALLPQDHPAKKYVLNRFNEQEIQTFSLGYSSGIEYEDIFKAFSEPLLELNYKNHDMFKNRIIFPIKDINGDVIGFTARAIDEQTTPKYINSPDSFLFDKKHVLYNINIAKKFATTNDLVIITEGVADTIKMLSIGFPNTVGLLGLDVSFEKVKLISSLSKNQILMLDNDNSGRKGTMEYIKNSIPLKAQIVVPIYKEKDPDMLLKQHSKEEVIKIIKKSVPGINYLVYLIKAKYDLNNVFQKQKFLQELYSLYNALVIHEQPLFADKVIKLVEKLGITKEAFLNIKDTDYIQEEPDTKVDFNTSNNLSNLNKVLLVLIINASDEIKEFLLNLNPDDFIEPITCDTIKNYQRKLKLNEVIDKYPFIYDYILSHYDSISDLPKEKVNDYFLKFKDYVENKLKIMRELTILNERLRNTVLPEEKAELVEKIIEIQQKIKTVSNNS